MGRKCRTPSVHIAGAVAQQPYFPFSCGSLATPPSELKRSCLINCYILHTTYCIHPFYHCIIPQPHDSNIFYYTHSYTTRFHNGYLRRLFFPLHRHLQQGSQGGPFQAGPGRVRYEQRPHSDLRTLHPYPGEYNSQDIVLIYLSPLIECQRTLLRSLRSQSRNLHVRRRTGLPDRLHGEVHRLLEHR